MGSLVLTDFILFGLVLSVIDGFWSDHVLDLSGVASLAAGLCLLHLFGFTYAHRLRGSSIRLIAVTAVAALILPDICDRLGITFSAFWVRRMLVIVCPLQLLLRRTYQRYCVDLPLEPLRWLLALAGGAAVGFPFLTNTTLGTGDAYWYANMVGDFVTQWRAGIFPVFVGQSDYAFNGAVSPLRLAPYLQHAAGVIDLLTFRTLPPAGLLNALLFSSLAGSALITYATLAAITRQGRWLALALAWLVIASPGILALAFSGDLFMSVCTLPFLPLVMFATWQTFNRPGTTSTCLLASTLAMVWLSHPPIAFWLTVIIAPSQLLQLPDLIRQRRAWQSWLAGAVLFGALTAFLFVSVATLRLPAFVAERNFIIQYASELFPAILMPVSEGATALSDYQLGWSLWLVFLVTTIGIIIRPMAFRIALVAGSGFLLVLLMPVPWLTASLWRHFPQSVINLTNHWPMQRFWVLIAFLVAYAGQCTLVDAGRGRRWLQALIMIFLLPALGWSWIESTYFTERGTRVTALPAADHITRLPQNRLLTRYAYNPFPKVPPYFSHGFVDPLLENRLLDRETLGEFDSNRRNILDAGPGRDRILGDLIARPNDLRHTSFSLLDQLPLEPHRRYTLEIRFDHPELSGSMILSGPTIQREYYLPDSAGGQTLPRPPTSFGSRPTSSSLISLWSSSDRTENVMILFVASPPLDADIGTFGHYVLKEFDPENLPVVVDSWSPYRARITAARPGFLETPRMFLTGYAASVNGHSTSVAISPSGLVMIPVPAGKSRVTVTYPGTPLLRFSYYFTLSAWLICLAWLMHSAVGAGAAAYQARRPCDVQ